MLPNSIEWFEATVAIARLGAQLVPINWHLKPDELAWILSDSDARGVADARRLVRRGVGRGYRRPGVLAARGRRRLRGRARGRARRAARRRREPGTVDRALHVGHHRSPEGRDAPARHHDAQPHGAERSLGLQPRRRPPPRRACVPRRAVVDGVHAPHVGRDLGRDAALERGVVPRSRRAVPRHEHVHGPDALLSSARAARRPCSRRATSRRCGSCCTARPPARSQ